MIYALLVRTYLWIYWFCEYQCLAECELGNPFDADPFFELIKRLETLLGINGMDYCYGQYECF